MNVVSINVGRCQPLPAGNREQESAPTGIDKRPVGAPVRVTREGLVGDEIGNPTVHGGPDQAVYLYGLPDYQWWEAELGRPLEPGIFGENLTLSALDNATLAIGDRFRIGRVRLEVTGPRLPCAIFARRLADSTLPKKFRWAERPGPYCRVLEEGEIGAGDAVHYEPVAGPRLSLLEVYRAEFVPSDDEATLRRHLAAPLASRIREAKEKRLAALRAKGGA